MCSAVDLIPVYKLYIVTTIIMICFYKQVIVTKITSPYVIHLQKDSLSTKHFTQLYISHPLLAQLNPRFPLDFLFTHRERMLHPKTLKMRNFSSLCFIRQYRCQSCLVGSRAGLPVVFVSVAPWEPRSSLDDPPSCKVTLSYLYALTGSLRRNAAK